MDTQTVSKQRIPMKSSSLSSPPLQELRSNHHIWMASNPRVLLKICNWSWMVANCRLPREGFSAPCNQPMWWHFDKYGWGSHHRLAIWHSGRCRTITQIPSRAGDSSLEGLSVSAWVLEAGQCLQALFFCVISLPPAFHSSLSDWTKLHYGMRGPGRLIHCCLSAALQHEFKDSADAISLQGVCILDLKEGFLFFFGKSCAGFCLFVPADKKTNTFFDSAW